jgi:hypothetical protein
MSDRRRPEKENATFRDAISPREKFAVFLK